jgi:hypothetical protein
MPNADQPDVTSTLTDLERKLVELERELGSVAGGGSAPSERAASGAAPAVAAPPSEVRPPALRVEDLRGQIADLVRFRDQLEAAARDLVSEYDRLVDRLQSTEPADPGVAAAPALAPSPAVPAPAPMGAPPVAPTWATSDQLPAAVAAGLPPSPIPQAAASSPQDATSFVGAVVVDAGPFADITTLTTFEQALGRVSGAEDVYVRSFEGDRALIDVRLSNPVPLLQLLREQLPLPINPRETGEGRVVVDVVASESHGN